VPSGGSAVVVVNYNGSGRLGACVASILREGVAPGDVLVVDEGSTDGSVRELLASHPSVRVVEHPENRGPAHARNRGYRALASRRILFVDDDVVIRRGCLEALSRALDENPQAVAGMPRVLHAHEHGRIQFDGANVYVLGNMKLLRPELLVAEAPAETRAMDSIVTACFLLDRDRFGDSDPFDEDFFYGLEDHDFGIRCRVAGHELLSVPAATCLHGGGTTGLSFRTFREYPTARVVYHIRNRWWILTKSYQKRTLVALSPILLVYEAFLLFASIRKGWLGAWTSAVRQTLAARKRLLAKRRDVQSRRRAPDRTILSGGPLPFRPQVTTSRPERIAVACLGFLADRYWSVVRRLL
jgi:N-acetylglucosaminyl-diphospho-decaprenol L-rhamnosyltransferase